MSSFVKGVCNNGHDQNRIMKKEEEEVSRLVERRVDMIKSRSRRKREKRKKNPGGLTKR